MATTQLTLSFGMPISPLGLWEIVQQAYDFLLFALEANKKGEKFGIEESDGNMLTVINGNGNTVFNFFPQALDLAGSAAQDYQRLANNIDDAGKVQQITISKHQEQLNDFHSIDITAKTKKLFKSSKRTEKIPIEVVVQIFRLDGKA